MKIMRVLVCLILCQSGCGTSSVPGQTTLDTSGEASSFAQFLQEGASLTHSLPEGRCTAVFLRRPPRTEAWSAEILSGTGEVLLDWQGGVDMAIQVCGPEQEEERVLVLRMLRGAGRVLAEFRGGDQPFDLESHSPNPRHVEYRPTVPVEITARLASAGFGLRDVRSVTSPGASGVIVPAGISPYQCASVYVDGDEGEVLVRTSRSQSFEFPAFFQWCYDGSDVEIEVTAPTGCEFYLWVGEAEEAGGQAGLWRPLI